MSFQPTRNLYLQKYLALVGILAAPGVWNAFPLVYPDTCRYLNIAFECHISCFSPVAFPLIMRPFFLFGPWWMMFSQCLIAALVLLEVSVLLSLRYIYLVSIVVLSGYFFTSSLLLSDVYFAVLFFVIFIYLENGKIINCIPVVILSTSHASFPIISILAMLSVAPFRAFDVRRLMAVCAAACCALFINIYFTYSYYGTATSPCSPAFLAARFIESDPNFFQDYVARHPDGILSINPTDFEAVQGIVAKTGRRDVYLWDKKSPIYVYGWLEGGNTPSSRTSRASRELADFVSSYIVNHPFRVAIDSVRNAFRYVAIAHTYSHTEVASVDIHEVWCVNPPKYSLQANGLIYYYLFNKVTVVGYYLSFIIILLSFVMKFVNAKFRTISQESHNGSYCGSIVNRFALFSMVVYIASGVITSNISVVDGRFQQWAYVLLFTAAWLLFKKSVLHGIISKILCKINCMSCQSPR